MSEYVWCHGPECHEYSTQDRIRGIGDNKVLRTRKIKKRNRGMFDYFCSDRCYNVFANKYVLEIIAIAPRHEPLETMVKVEKIKHPEHSNGGSGYLYRAYTETTITKLDNSLE
jgi:endogenous inhibitor of DNA gyrase (YacG/DUF329 family)